MDEKTLLERLSENPESIAEFSREELIQAQTDLKEAGRQYVAAVKAGESEDPKADLDAAKEAKERLEAVNARLAEFEAEDEVITDTATELESAFAEAEVEEPEAEEAEVEETPEEVVETPEAEVEVEAELEPALVATEKISIGAIAKRAPKPKIAEKSLVASASAAVKGRQEFTTPGTVFEAMADVFKRTTAAPGAAPVNVASFDTGKLYEHTVTGDEQHDAKVISDLQKELRGGLTALTASGGICAPAQPVYDFFSIVAEDGLIQLPTVNAARGRLTYPVSPSFADVIADADWANAAGNQYTNANSEAGATKPNFHVDCPSTSTCTVDAYPVILEFGNFAQRFYPEFVENSISLSMAYHTHFVNESLINAMVTASTLTGTGDTGGGGIVNVANLIGFEAAKYRDRFRMDMDARLTLVAPTWVRDALVADYVARNATTSWGNARGAVADLLGSLNLDVQWVSDWQSIGDNNDGGWPSAADMMLFAPGTFVRLDGGELNLGIVRDSTLNATNDFQTFIETFESVCEIGHDSWLLDGVVICPRGSAGADVTLDCNPGFGS